MMLPLRHWPAVSLVLILLVSSGLTAHAQSTSPAATLTGNGITSESHGPSAGMILRSPASGSSIVLTAAAESRDKDTSESDDEIMELKKRIIELQNKGKLGFRKLAVCSKVEGYGIYSPLEPGKPIRNFVLYFEPANVSTLVTPGRYVVDCTIDVFQVRRDASGKTVGRRMKKLKINKVSRSPVLDLHFALNLAMKKPLKTDLIVRIVLYDNIKNQSATANYRINVKKKDKKGPKEV